MSCCAYRDTWSPFFALLRTFWRECPYPLWLLTDHVSPSHIPFPENINIHTYGDGVSWTAGLADGAWWTGSDPILLMQDDFYLTDRVRPELIERALEQLEIQKAGGVRLYPCPGATADYGDPHFGIVDRGTPYRTSCQATIWNPDYLRDIALHAKGTPADFEIKGSRYASDHLPQEMLAFKREVAPWPLQYLCSAISRGRWNPDAKRLCEEFGIEADWSKRPMEGVL